ncbi:hypothetical protein N9X61_03740 [Sulfurimonas sp.]|nr:hypothetical protein [Sulfurimonas sp.]
MSFNTIEEYKQGLYYGLIDINNEFECYDIDRGNLSDFEAIEYLLEIAIEAGDYTTKG